MLQRSNVTIGKFSEVICQVCLIVTILNFNVNSPYMLHKSNVAFGKSGKVIHQLCWIVTILVHSKQVCNF